MARRRRSVTGYRSMFEWSAEELAQYWAEADARQFGRLARDRTPRDIWAGTACFPNDETDVERTARLNRHAAVLAELAAAPTLDRKAI